MKKIISSLLILAMLGSFVGCQQSSSTVTSETVIVEEDVTEETAVTDEETADSKTTGTTSTSGSTTGNVIDTNKIDSVQNLDFGGKTIKMAITSDKTPSDSDKRLFADYEKKFNCKLKYDVIDFSSYLKTISNKIATNAPYDILYIHGSFFPTAAISRLCAPLDDAIYDKDKFSSSNISAGGIDMDKTAYWKWSGKTYAVSGYSDINYLFFYYNKQKWSSNLSQYATPDVLASKGEWTLDKFYEIGSKVSDAANNKYFVDSTARSVATFGYGANVVLKKSDKDVVANLSDSRLFDGLKTLQKWFDKNTGIATNDKGSATDPGPTFLKGETYGWFSEDLRWGSVIVPGIKEGKLGGNLKNVGFAPIPTATASTKQYAGWIQGIAACRGTSDITPAVAFAWFRSQWTDSKTSDTTLPAEAQAIRNKYLGNLNYRMDSYTSGSAEMTDMTHQMQMEVIAGNDIQSVLTKYKNSMQNAIDVTLKKQ